MLGFKCKHAVTQRSHTRGHSAKPPAAAAQLICRRRSRQQYASSSEPAPTSRTPINRKILRTEEAVLHTQNRLVNSEDQARYTSLCSRISSVCSPACILTLPTRTSVSSELARASWTLMELFEMDRHQL